jgi:tripartite ATP-independent transporter DctP family solute receptor
MVLLKMFANSLLSLTMIGTLLLLTACGQYQSASTVSKSQGAATSSETIRLKSADVVAATSPYTLGMEKFTEAVKAKTNGKIQIKHFPAGQLGKDSEIVEGVKLGSIDIGLVGAIMESKVANGFSIPYLFEDMDHMDRVLKSEIGETLKKKFEEETGLKLIGFVKFAPRVLTTKGKEIKTPADLKGLKIRVPETPVYIESWKALGANPTPIAFTELFSALQMGIVEGQENPYEIIYNNSFYEVQDIIIETNHALPARYLIMNKKRYDSLSPEEQQLLQTEWATTAAYIDKLFKESEQDYIQKLKDKSMKFITPDREAFKQATAEIREKFAIEAFGKDIYDQIKAMGKQ